MTDLVLSEATVGDANEIFALLERMFEESPMEPLNGDKALVEIQRVIEKEGAWIVRDMETEDDKIVASAGLVQAAFWFSDAPIIVTRWIYALPAYRGDENAWGLLKKEIAVFCDAIDRSAYLDVHNPLKERKGSRIEQSFARFSYHPRGARLRMKPKEAA